MKKIVTLLVVFGFLFGLTACAETPDDKDKQTIELTYADWGNQDFNQQMIDAFMVKYPHIKVSLRKDIAGSGADFTGNLAAVAQLGLLPDVFATDNVPTVINAGLTLDVAQYWDKDEDADLVYPNIALTGVYNGKRYAVPSFQFFKGIMMNLNIFDRAGLVTVPNKYRVDEYGYPVKDWTYSEFIEIAKTIKNRNLDNPETLVLGIDGWFGWVDFQQVWPTLDNANTQYDTWDGTSFNYNSTSWITAMSAKIDIHKLNDGTLDDIVATDLFKEDGTYIPGREYLAGWRVQTGYTAMNIDGTWNFGVINTIKNNLDVTMGFWPYPSGPAGTFPPTILDYQCVSIQTPYPEEAFLLAKWMTFGRDGWNARMDIYDANHAASIAKGELPTLLDRFPVADYDDVWARILPYTTEVEGLNEIISNLEYSKPDLDKWLGGYKDFWAWVYDPENPYNWDNFLAAGSSATATYAAEWNTKVNQLVTAEMNRLGKDD
jgi:multiple sugar transport system substrate-binding protein